LPVLYRKYDREGVAKYHHIDDCGADVIVIAGDLDTGLHGVFWANKESERLKTPIVYVPGNHEYYGNKIVENTYKMKEYANDTEVHVLERDVVVLEEVRFLGCTLWTDFCLYGYPTAAMYHARQTMQDFPMIRQPNNHQRLEPIFTAELHQNSVYWLTQELKKPFDGKTVFVTHHAPSE
jgi:hypothetical protein